MNHLFGAKLRKNFDTKIENEENLHFYLYALMLCADTLLIAKVRKRPFSCNFCTVLAESYFPKSLTVSTLQRSPRAWCLLLRVPVCYTQDCNLLTPGAPKQKKSVFCVMNMPSCTLKNGMFRPEKPAFSPRNMPCFKTQNPL